MLSIFIVLANFILISKSNSDWHNIHITFDYSNNTTSDKTTEFLSKIIEPKIKQRLNNIIKVQGDQKIKLSNIDYCFEKLKISSENINKEIETDLYILIIIKEEPLSSYIASSAPCLYNTEKRPYLGRIIINKSNFKITTENTFYFVNNILHEIFHILIFAKEIILNHPKLYKNFFANFVSNGIERVKLISNEIRLFGKNHFGCSSFDGLWMENGTLDSDGTHFEFNYIGNEMMNPAFNVNPVLSEFTGAFLEDAGYYKIDKDYLSTLYFGKDKGCDFLKGNCDPKFEEFCENLNEIGCSNDFEGKSICEKTTFSENCKINKIKNTYSCRRDYDFEKTTSYEESGKNSRCFKVKQDSNLTSGCFKSKCEEKKLIITINGKDYNCTDQNIVIKIDEIKIYCPDPKYFCKVTELNKCSNDCNGKGQCLNNGDCFCDYFYKGGDCSEFNGCSGISSSLCDEVRITESGKYFSKGFINVILFFVAILAFF